MDKKMKEKTNEKSEKKIRKKTDRIRKIVCTLCLTLAMAAAAAILSPAQVSAATSGTLDGFIDWMLEQNNLTSAQKADLENAREMLDEYVAAGYIDLSDDDDAAAIDNLEKAAKQLKTLKSLRNSDPYYSQVYGMTTLYTNFTMMTGSAYTADVSVYKLAHVSKYSTFAGNEGLAWGYSSPVSLWYSEVAYIEKAMDELGYSASSLTETKWSEVKKLAASYGEIGHYTGLFYGVPSGKDTLMGIGYTTESYIFYCTASYNASTPYDGEAVYTPAQFLELIEEYKATLITSDDVTLSYSSCTYTGDSRKPKVTVTVNGKTLTKNTDYTVTYSNNKSIGKATVKIKGIGNYSGTVKKTFKILPKKGTISSVKSSSSKKITVKWKKVSGSVTKYQIRYRYKTSSGYSSWKKKTVSASTLSKTLTGLKSGKTYQVQVRAYKTVNGKNYVGKWSAAKKVKTK